MKKELPLVVAFLTSFIVVVAYFFNIPSVITTSNNLVGWGVLVSAFALGLAAVNLVRVHLTKIRKQGKGWQFSILLLVAMFTVIFAGLTQGTNSQLYKYVFVTPRSALGASIYSLIGFYVASASYRAFVAKNVDATILLISAVIVLVGKTPYATVVWSGFPRFVDWIMNVPNMAAQRGIIIGIAVGAVALSLRIMVGLERSSLGADS